MGNPDELGAKREAIVRKVLDTSYNFANGADNPISLNEKMRKYLIGVYQWYYKKDVYASTYDTKIDIQRIERILIQNHYNKKDKDFLNDIKMTILEIEVDMKSDRAQATEGGTFEDLFN